MRKLVRLTFVEPMLGTVPFNKEVATDWVVNKNPSGAAPDEVETLPDVAEQLEKASTGFHRDADGQIYIYNYMVKGFLKAACGALRREDEFQSKKLTNYKKNIDNLVHVHPRRIPIKIVSPMSWLERPLRAQTAQGERIALARSETVPEQTAVEFEIEVIGGKTISDALICEWLDFGKYVGLGQWRSGGYGAFIWEEIK